MLGDLKSDQDRLRRELEEFSDHERAEMAAMARAFPAWVRRLR